jgi:outer membrane protein
MNMNRSGCNRSPKWPLRLSQLIALLVLLSPCAHAQTNTAATTNTTLPEWITRPLSLAEALDIALQQNSALQKSKAELEAAYGVAIQTRAIAIPRVEVTGRYTWLERGGIETFPFSSSTNAISTNSIKPLRQANNNWSTRVQVVQSIYEGGRVMSALRSAKLSKEQALLNYRTAIADTLTATRIAYYDVLVAAQQIVVNEASVALLGKEFQDQQRRYEAGTVPRFNSLRAEVAVANARPPLIRARNAYRIAKNNLATLLGYNLPRGVWEDIPLRLTDPLAAEPYSIELPEALDQALSRRTELGALRKQEALQRENIVNARSGYKPSIQVFAGYEQHNSQFTDDPSVSLGGWLAGAQLSWNIFDGLQTQGRIKEARALHERSEADIEETGRRIELEVRTAYSIFLEAREVLESQQKVQEQAEESLRLATARAEAGSGTQLDVLDAETSLTQARTTQVQALHDYAVARARLERAIGSESVVNGQ